jgi:hypothetical protein
MSDRHLSFQRTVIDVTSAHRPDEAWRFTDAAGHEHRWYLDGQPMTDYDHLKKTELPTLEIVRDPDEYDSDGEPYAVYHWECRQCHAVISPGFRADSEERFITGLMRMNDFVFTVTDPDDHARYCDMLIAGTKSLHAIDGHIVEIYIISVKDTTVTARPVKLVS